VSQILIFGQTGNILFQLAFASNMKKKPLVNLDLLEAYKKEEDLVKFIQLLKDLNLETAPLREVSWLIRKCLNLMIRLSSNSLPQIFSRNRALLTHMMSFFLKLLRYQTKIYVADGVDDIFDQEQIEDGLIIGYFQNHLLVENKFVKTLISNALEKTLPNTTARNPTVHNAVLVHIRLGDYEEDGNIGVCSAKYFETALSTINQKNKISSIKLYSNNEEKARLLLPSWARILVEGRDNSSSSPFEIIQSMRRHRFYVLSNSTFGWWGAALSDCDTPEIYVPDPWFRRYPDPHNLVPRNWKKIKN
jgi:hypothetical protein